MRRAWMCAAALVAICATASAGTTESVEQAIADGKKFLFSQQQDGAWEREFDKHGDQATGQTALVIYALLACGESHQDPRIAPAIEYLKNNETTGVYALAIRCQVWLALPPTPEVKTAMARDAKALLGAIRSDGAGRGFYNYNPGGRAFSLSRGHYASLGAWAAAQQGVEVPESYWQLVEKAWIDNQDDTGGWAYKGRSDSKYSVTPGMTADGICTLFITQDYLHANDAAGCKGNVRNPHIDKAMGWLTDNYEKISGDEKFTRDYPYATMYAIERVGAASGLKYFKGIDWYEKGVERLLRNRRSNGSWSGDVTGGNIAGTCMALIFLTAGRAPVTMNKLDYSADKPTVGWNQRPRDVANVTRWISRQTERPLNWQSVTLDAPIADFHDSSILYLAGSQELKLSTDAVAKLRQFVEGGGLILGNSDCGNSAFSGSFRRLGKQLFPDYEFRQIIGSHPILSDEQYPASKWKRKPALLGLSNGARELMLLVPDADMGKFWQLQDNSGREELFQLAANIFLYAVGKDQMRFKNQTHLVAVDPKISTTRTIELARVKYGGTWDPEPGGWRRLSAVMNNRDKVALKVNTVELNHLDAATVKIAHLTGTSRFKLTAEQREQIKAFINDGGTLIVDSAGGGGEFSQSFESEMDAMFPEQARQLKTPLKLDHPLFRAAGAWVEPLGYRAYARKKTLGDLKAPRVRGMELDGRLAVIYSPEDLSVGLVGQGIDGIVGYDPATATNLVRCALLLASHPAPTSQPATRPAPR
ncbi:MAG: DUF4159 domain-containing protein [Tepidisphaeraceae bacterium]